VSDITDVTATPVEQGVTGAGSEGTGTGTVTKTAEKLFNQDQLNSVVQARIEEERKRLKVKNDEAVTAKLKEAQLEWEKGLDSLVQTKLTEREAAAAMATARAALVSELGLTEAQVARLNGDTPEELAADAKALFGKFIPDKDPIADARKEAMTRTGLTEKQVARLTGDTLEEMLADAVDLFGVKVAPATEPDQKPAPKPPILKSGPATGAAPEFMDMATMTADEVRKNRINLWPKG
jgi:hypothetical protein